MDNKSEPEMALEPGFLRDWQKNLPPLLTPKYLAISALVAVLYFFSAKLGLRLALVHPSATPVWPPTGIALAVFLVLGVRVWPAIFLSAFLVNLTTAGTVATSVGIAIGNTAEGLVGAYLVNRFAGGLRVFDRAQTIFRFAVLAGMLSTAVSATVGVTTLSVAGFANWADYGAVWLTWWLGDGVGALIVAPVVVLWFVSPRPRWDWDKAFEAIALGTGLVVSAWIAFGPLASMDSPIKYLCWPFLMWAAFRFGKVEAATAVLMLSVVGVWSAGGVAESPG